MFLILITNKSAMYYEQLIVILAQKLPKEYLKILLSLILEIVKFNIGLNPIKHFIYLFFFYESCQKNLQEIKKLRK